MCAYMGMLLLTFPKFLPRAHTRPRFFAGAIMSSFLAPAYSMGPVEGVGRRTGMASTAASLGDLLGLPIAGAIQHTAAGYKGTGYFGGSCVIVAVGLMVVTRHFVLGRA
jgi:hypothetical protein